MKRVCVKRLNHPKTHLVDVLARAVEEDWTYQKRTFVGIETPLVTICAVLIESKLGCVEVVEEAPTCQKCIVSANKPLDRA